MAEITYIKNEAHYGKVLQAALQAKRMLWIGTADLKDLYVKHNNVTMPFLRAVAGLLRKKVEVRLIHAKEPGARFRDDFDKHPELVNHLERMLCPRVHFKLIIVDSQWAYIGSANLTGAGMGMKSLNRRNFESGIWTNDSALVESAMSQFDDVWIGKHCPKCGRKEFCSDRVLDVR